MGESFPVVAVGAGQGVGKGYILWNPPSEPRTVGPDSGSSLLLASAVSGSQLAATFVLGDTKSLLQTVVVDLATGRETVIDEYEAGTCLPPAGCVRSRKS